MENNKNWIYVGMAVVAIVAIIGLSFFYNTPSTTKQNQVTVNQNKVQNQVTSSVTPANEDIDALLNDLDSQENQVNQSLNDQAVDVLAD
jgi:peptidoglycan hydrolase CwlO-like protein